MNNEDVTPTLVSPELPYLILGIGGDGAWPRSRWLADPFSCGSFIRDSLPALTDGFMVLPGFVGIRVLVLPDYRTILKWTGGQGLECGRWGGMEKGP